MATGTPAAATGWSAIANRRRVAQSGKGATYHQRRSEIIRASAAVFRTKGYGGTSLGDIASAVGANRSTLYYYVAGKEELFDEIVTDVVLANLAAVEQIRDCDAPAVVKIRTLVTQLMSSYAEHYPFLYVYLQENLSQVAEERRPWARQMRSVNRRYEAAVEAIVAAGVADGSLLRLSETYVLAYGIMGMVSWSHRWFNPEQSPVDAAAIGAAYAQVLLHGLGVAAERGPAEVRQ